MIDKIFNIELSLSQRDYLEKLAKDQKSKGIKLAEDTIEKNLFSSQAEPYLKSTLEEIEDKEVLSDISLGEVNAINMSKLLTTLMDRFFSKNNQYITPEELLAANLSDHKDKVYELAFKYYLRGVIQVLTTWVRRKLIKLSSNMLKNQGYGLVKKEVEIYEPLLAALDTSTEDYLTDTVEDFTGMETSQKELLINLYDSYFDAGHNVNIYDIVSEKLEKYFNDNVEKLDKEALQKLSSGDSEVMDDFIIDEQDNNSNLILDLYENQYLYIKPPLPMDTINKATELGLESELISAIASIAFGDGAEQRIYDYAERLYMDRAKEEISKEVEDEI